MEITIIEVIGWGCFGSLAVDALEIFKGVRTNGGRWPEDCRTLSFFLAEGLRILVATGSTIAFRSSERFSGAFGAVAVGVLAPWVEKRSKQLPTYPPREEHHDK